MTTICHAQDYWPKAILLLTIHCNKFLLVGIPQHQNYPNMTTKPLDLWHIAWWYTVAKCEGCVDNTLAVHCAGSLGTLQYRVDRCGLKQHPTLKSDPYLNSMPVVIWILRVMYKPYVLCELSPCTWHLDYRDTLLGHRDSRISSPTTIIVMACRCPYILS